MMVPQRGFIWAGGRDVCRDGTFFIPALKTVYMEAGRDVCRDGTLFIPALKTVYMGGGTLFIPGLHENVSIRDDFTR